MIFPDSSVPERPVSLREYVESSLRQQIAIGELPPGSRLIERELCSAFQVSRSLVREALRKLEAEKLITVIPYKGPIVSRIDTETVLELYSVRCLLEGYAVELFTQHASDAEIRKLGEVVDELESLVSRNIEPSGLSETKDRIYGIILNGCGNGVLQELFVTLLSRIALYRSMSLNSPGRPRQTCQEIRSLYECIFSRDVTRARAAAEIHIENAKLIVVAALRSRTHR